MTIVHCQLSVINCPFIRHKLAALDELKKSLPHQAFSGQLTRGLNCHDVTE